MVHAFEHCAGQGRSLSHSLFSRLIPDDKARRHTRGKGDLYRAGFTIAFAIRSVDSIQSLDSTKYITPALSGARCPAYKARWYTRGKMHHLRKVAGYYTPAAPLGLYKMNALY